MSIVDELSFDRLIEQLRAAGCKVERLSLTNNGGRVVELWEATRPGRSATFQVKDDDRPPQLEVIRSVAARLDLDARLFLPAGLRQ